jgi:hypothetical protein
LAARDPRRHSTITSVSTRTIYAERFQPSERRPCANWKLSVMSGRSFHTPKNSDSASSPNVEPLGLAAEETTTTISAGPTGMSAGRVMWISRFGGISALTFTVLTISAEIIIANVSFFSARHVQICVGSRQESLHEVSFRGCDNPDKHRLR